MNDLNPISELQKYVGNYTGQGINHDNQKFTGELIVESIVGRRGALLTFTATGEDGTVYHEEKSTISPSMDEKILMWNFNSNVPGLVPHELKKSEAIENGSKFIFGFNDKSNENAFREEIALELYNNGDIGYHYSWGLPHGEFKERSGLVMKPSEEKKPDLNHIHLAVNDLEKSKQFYAQMLGFKDRTMHGKCLFMSNDEGYDLALDPEVEPVELPNWFHIGVRLPSKKSIEDLYSKFESNGQQYVARKIERYDDFIFFHAKDPDGYKIEIYWE